MRNIVDNRTAVLTRSAGVASSRNMKGNRNGAVLNCRPHRIVKGQIVVRMGGVMRPPDGFAGQGQTAKTHFGNALDFGDSEVNVGGEDGRHRRHEIVVRAEDFPRPIVPTAALGIAELGVLRGPYSEALVGED